MIQGEKESRKCMYYVQQRKRHLIHKEREENDLRSYEYSQIID